MSFTDTGGKNTWYYIEHIVFQRWACYANDTIGTQRDQRHRFSRSVQGKFRINMMINLQDHHQIYNREFLYVALVYSRGGTSELSSKFSRFFFFFLWARFRESSVIFRKSRISVDGPISRRTRRETAGGRTVITFVSRSLDFFFLVDSSFLTIVVHGVKRAIVITKLPVVVFRWILLLSTDTSQGRVNCRIFPFMITRT